NGRASPAGRPGSAVEPLVLRPGGEHAGEVEAGLAEADLGEVLLGLLAEAVRAPEDGLRLAGVVSGDGDVGSAAEGPLQLGEIGAAEVDRHLGPVEVVGLEAFHADGRGHAAGG